MQDPYVLTGLLLLKEHVIILIRNQSFERFKSINMQDQTEAWHVIYNVIM